jgi:hypothetical protein
MAQESLARNPFMMMLNPEVVLAAMERSEKLGRLNRRMCHPLDRPLANPGDDVALDVEDSGDTAGSDN